MYSILKFVHGGDKMVFNVKKIREEKGISQEELSKKTGISRTIISGMETGLVKNATVETVKKIAQALDVKISDIFFDYDV